MDDIDDFNLKFHAVTMLQAAPSSSLHVFTLLRTLPCAESDTLAQRDCLCIENNLGDVSWTLKALKRRIPHHYFPLAP